VHNMETITTADKDQRDRMYADLRQNGDEFERQVVKFSDCELIGEVKKYRRSGQLDGPYEIRSVYRSVWGLAYPRS
jgi:hypothetical protein